MCVCVCVCVCVREREREREKEREREILTFSLRPAKNFGSQFLGKVGTVRKKKRAKWCDLESYEALQSAKGEPYLALSLEKLWKTKEVMKENKKKPKVSSKNLHWRRNEQARKYWESITGSSYKRVCESIQYDAPQP